MQPAGLTKRGLRVFINDIRLCKSREEEVRRVARELTNVRKKFAGGKTLSRYDRQKYVLKLVYIYLLGFEVDFGHVEAINLASSAVPREKQIGYLAMGLLVNTDSEVARLISHTIRTDLGQASSPVTKRLALNYLANCGGRELCSILHREILTLSEDGDAEPLVRTKAMLCLRTFSRIAPDLVPAAEILSHTLPLLNNTYHIGRTLATLGLLKQLALRDPAPFAVCLPVLSSLLEDIVVNRNILPAYYYHDIPCPTVVVAILQFLQMYPIPSSEDARRRLSLTLQTLLEECDPNVTFELKPNPYKTNARNALLFEATNLVTHYGDGLDRQIMATAVRHLGPLVAAECANTQGLALATISRLALAAQRDANLLILTQMRAYQPLLRATLQSPDAFIRKKALDLMFALCDGSIVNRVVPEMIEHLRIVSHAMKRETVLKIAILAERHAVSYPWYIDTILRLIAAAGDFMSDDVWHRAVQVITSKPDVQSYAARAMLRAIEPPHVPEATVKIAAYVIGEFGWRLIEPPQGRPLGVPLEPTSLFECINQHFGLVSNSTRSIMLHAYVKLAHRFPGQLEDNAKVLIDAYRDASDPDLQQRACEYYELLCSPVAARALILTPIPPFSTDRLSAVVRSLEAGRGPTGQGAKDTDRYDTLPSDSDSEPDIASPRSSPGGRGVEFIQPEAGSEVTEPIVAVTRRATAGPVTVTLSCAQTSEERLFRSALLGTKSLLFENDAVQIGVQRDFQGERVAAVLYIGNKAREPLTHLVSTFGGLGAHIRLTAGPIPSDVPVGAQVRQSIQLACIQPFSDSPMWTLTFSLAGQPTSIRLGLPFCVSSFSTAVPVVAEMECRARVQDATWSATETVHVTNIGAALLQHVVRILESLHFTVLGASDVGSELLAVCTVQTASSEALTPFQDRVSYGCAVRVRLEEHSCFITVLAMDETLAAGVKHVLLDTFSTLVR